MARISFGRSPCPVCRDRITNNALGRAAHIRACQAKRRAAEAAPTTPKASKEPKQ